MENSVGFHSYLLTSEGIVDSVVSAPLPPMELNVGYLSIKMSPKNDKILVTDNHVATIFDFDSSTGVVSNPIDIGFHLYRYGEFSESGNKVYCNTSTVGTLQYDLLAPNIQFSESLISSTPAFGIQRGPNSKVYGVNSEGIFCIENPENDASSCGFSIVYDQTQVVHDATGLVNNINIDCFNINRIKIARVCSENSLEFKSNHSFDLNHENNFYSDINHQVIDLNDGINSIISTQVKCDSLIMQNLQFSRLESLNDSCSIFVQACSILDPPLDFRINHEYTEDASLTDHKYYSFQFSCDLSGWHPNESQSVEYPNVITFNNDGVNDLFKPVNSEIPYGTIIYFYDRWGNSVGNLNKNSSYTENETIWNNLTGGTYYYIIESGCKDDKIGFLHLIK